MQRILVTGANRGIGLEFVRQCLLRGARVFAACRQPGKALKLTELAAAHPGRLSVLPLDLDKERSIAELARETAALTDALDLLINNAGVLVPGERYGELVARTLIDTFTTNGVETAQVDVDGTVYAPAVGDTFGPNKQYRLQSVSGNCATFLYGDESFTLCVAQNK